MESAVCRSIASRASPAADTKIPALSDGGVLGNGSAAGAALAEQQEEYAQLEAALAKWTESRAEWGVFRMLAQAAVRPLR